MHLFNNIQALRFFTKSDPAPHLEYYSDAKSHIIIELNRKCILELRLRQIVYILLLLRYRFLAILQ